MPTRPDDQAVEHDPGAGSGEHGSVGATPALPVSVIFKRFWPHTRGFRGRMAANLAPAPAGVGAVDGGLIGAFAILGYPLDTVIAAVLIYRLMAFYLPVPPGIIAFFQLRRTVARWDQERARAAAGTATVPRAGEAGTS